MKKDGEAKIKGRGALKKMEMQKKKGGMPNKSN